MFLLRGNFLIYERKLRKTAYLKERILSAYYLSKEMQYLERQSFVDFRYYHCSPVRRVLIISYWIVNTEDNVIDNVTVKCLVF